MKRRHPGGALPGAGAPGPDSHPFPVVSHLVVCDARATYRKMTEEKQGEQLGVENFPARVARVPLVLTFFLPVVLGCQSGARDDSYRAEDRATWGDFRAWSQSPRFRDAHEAMVDYLRNQAAMHEARRALALEAERNQRAEVPPEEWREPIFPETSGSFEFVQILSQHEGTSIFRASDGLFVLLLSPGDSFRAYPGQGVRLTMHNRGETMGLNVGTAVVFRSGPSPTQARRSEGFRPDRTREDTLRKAVAASEEQLKASVSASGTMMGPFYARIEVRTEPDLTASRFLVFDRGGAVYCVTDMDANTDCPTGIAEHVRLSDLGS